MTALAFEILPFNFASASDAEYAALNRHFNRAKAETLPDDPPTPLEETIAQMQNVPSFVSVEAWIGWNPEKTEMIASGVVSFLKTEENTHLVQFDLSVDPQVRRQGMGRELLRHCAEAAQRENRRLMMTDTNERVPAGEAFMQRLSAERGLEMHTNQLVLAELDFALIAQWQAEGQARAAGFTLGFWDGPYPGDQLDAVAKLSDVMNTAPREGLDMEDMHMTPDQLRQMEQMQAAMGTERWTVYAADTATGRFAGFTEVHWNPNRPEIVSQGGTGVFPECRGLGLGRWLKAAMLDRIVRNRPPAKFVRTGNADSNAAMLGINHALGFTPYISRTIWQLDTEKALAYLAEKPQ
jgi:mycothiol synthase